MKNIDEEIAAGVAKAMEAAHDLIGEIPLVGINPQRMYDIEAKGLEICKTRLTAITEEIKRLSEEAGNTTAIIDAGEAKLKLLRDHLQPRPAAPPKLSPSSMTFQPPKLDSGMTLQNSAIEADPSRG